MKQIPSIFALLLAICCFVSCYKDKGNYTYHDVNEVTFQNFDSAKGYVAYVGETFQVMPTVKGSLLNEEAAYSYEWSYEDVSKKPVVISGERNLNFRINMLPGLYTLIYKVTDKATGVQYPIRAPLQVSTDIYEGFLVLNNVNGKSRLDMLSYKKENGQFAQYTDVLAKMGSTLPEQGVPYKVFCMHATTVANTDPKFYKIYLSTASGTNCIDAETFGYTPTNNIRYEMMGDVPQNFIAYNFGGDYQANQLPTMYMFGDNSIFIRRNNYLVFPYVPLNTYAGAVAPFKASPYFAANTSFVMMYNTEKRTFARTQATASTTVFDMPANQNYPVGKDLLFMEINYTGAVHAILKDPSSEQYSIIRFNMGAIPDYNQAITAPDFNKATRYAVSPDRGYLFYSVGGKVYEYDLALKTTKLMIDKGADEITYLGFHRFYFRTLYPNYDDWGKLLNVGSFASSGSAATGGALEQYYVPPVNGALELRNKWTGFGKITSISYRERR